MTETTYRKTSAMRMLERLHPGRTIEQIVEDACREQPTPEAAAVVLGISKETLRVWRGLMDLEEREPVGVA